jgi:hypothetical protein
MVRDVKPHSQLSTTHYLPPTRLGPHVRSVKPDCVLPGASRAGLVEWRPICARPGRSRIIHTDGLWRSSFGSPTRKRGKTPSGVIPSCLFCKRPSSVARPSLTRRASTQECQRGVTGQTSANCGSGRGAWQRETRPAAAASRTARRRRPGSIIRRYANHSFVSRICSSGFE